MLLSDHNKFVTSNYVVSMAKMDGAKEQSIHHTALKICDDIQHHSSYKNMYSDIQVSKKNIHLHKPTNIFAILEASGNSQRKAGTF